MFKLNSEILSTNNRFTNKKDIFRLCKLQVGSLSAKDLEKSLDSTYLTQTYEKKQAIPHEP